MRATKWPRKWPSLVFLKATDKVAEREGFEPSEPLRIHMISNHAHSTTLPPLRRNKPRTVTERSTRLRVFIGQLKAHRTPVASRIFANAPWSSSEADEIDEGDFRRRAWGAARRLAVRRGPGPEWSDRFPCGSWPGTGRSAGARKARSRTRRSRSQSRTRWRSPRSSASVAAPEGRRRRLDAQLRQVRVGGAPEALAEAHLEGPLRRSRVLRHGRDVELPARRCSLM